MRQRCCVDGFFQQAVFNAVQFQREEQKLGGGVGDLFLRIAIKFGMGGIGRVARIDKSGIGHDATEQIFDGLIILDRRKQFGAGVRPGGDIGQLATPFVCKSGAIFGGPLEVARVGGAVHGRIEIGQIPFGQGAEGGVCSKRGHDVSGP